jgi:type IV pilus assembly protein PilW
VRLQPRPARRDAGFTIVELLIAMVIGMIAIVVMFQIFAVSEGQRRTTTGSGDAQQNGVTSLFIMERDARMAGYGFNFMPLLGCSVDGYYAPTGTPFNFRLLPLLIADGGGAAPDSITFAYGSADYFGLPSTMNADKDYAGTYFRTIDPVQFRPGDIFLAAQVPAAGLPIAQPCLALQATRVNPEDMWFNDGSYVNDHGDTRVTQYRTNSPIPIDRYRTWAPGTDTGGRLLNLGSSPVAMTYSLQNSQLRAFNAFRPDETVAVSDGIVQMQAVYGFSSQCPHPTNPAIGCRIADNAAVVDTISLSGGDQWGHTMPAGALPRDWRKIIAARIAIVSRSMQPERPVNGACVATTTMPVWAGLNQVLDVSADPNWRCYRYRVFEMVVPVRNLMWYADPLGGTVAPAL